MLDFSDCLACIYWNVHIFKNLLVYWITLIYPQLLTQPFISGIKSHFGHDVVFFLYIAKMLLLIFVFMLMRDIHLQFSLQIIFSLVLVSG